jgi:hypothetical protein
MPNYGFDFSDKGIDIPAGVEGAVGGLMDVGREGRSIENQQAAMKDRYRYGVLDQMQNKPFAPYATLGKGRLLGAIAKAWGLEKQLGSDLLNYISDPMNVPGTQGIGGAGNLQGPEATGITAPQYKKPGFWSKFGAIAGGVAKAFL